MNKTSNKKYLENFVKSLLKKTVVKSVGFPYEKVFELFDEYLADHKDLSPKDLLVYVCEYNPNTRGYANSPINKAVIELTAKHMPKHSITHFSKTNSGICGCIIIGEGAMELFANLERDENISPSVETVRIQCSIKTDTPLKCFGNESIDGYIKNKIK